MASLIDETADYVLELASSQRLGILIGLLTRQYTPTAFAKSIGATKQEVHRNFSRLEKAGLVKKNVDGTYSLTTFGQVVCAQVPSLVFISQNRKYFEEHNFGDIPHKFQMRCGQLANCQYVRGVTKVLEAWKSICKNSNEYIHVILSEVPWT